MGNPGFMELNHATFKAKYITGDATLSLGDILCFANAKRIRPNSY